MDHSISTISDQSSSNYSVPPAINGLLERFYSSLKTLLIARLMNNANWLAELPLVLLGFRTSPKEDLGASSELVYDEALKLPDELMALSSCPWSSSDPLHELKCDIRLYLSFYQAQHRYMGTQGYLHYLH